MVLFRLPQSRWFEMADLADPGTSFNLHLATLAWRTLQTLRS